MSARNQTVDELTKWLNLRTTQYGDTSKIRYRKHWSTDIPSIQGPWTPLTHKNPENNLAFFPDTELGKLLFQKQTATEKLLEIAQEKQQMQAKDAAALPKDE